METQTERRVREPVETKILRIAEKAKAHKELKFNNLYHLLCEELLESCFWELRADAAVGVDKRSKADYEERLYINIDVLNRCLHQMSYRPLPSRRVWIPKPGSDKQRPLGIPAIEDKLVQAALVKILEPIYEQDFIDTSFGFRPKRSCHQALKVVDHTIMRENINYIVEADIKGFFDNVNHDWMMKMIFHRVEDKRILQMIKRFLIAGIMEDGRFSETDKGTPQGGVISPLLANIYLHYALDRWFIHRFMKSCKGFSKIIRYADDFIVCVECKSDAERFLIELNQRLGIFGLETEPSKTKILAFGKSMASEANQKGRKLDTFDFLGFTHYMGKDRTGKRFTVKRKTARKKFKTKIAAFKMWIHSAIHRPFDEVIATIAAKLQGHYAYYGISDNYRGIKKYEEKIKSLTHKWLNRRSQRKSMNWNQFRDFWKRIKMPEPKIRVYLY